MLYTPEQITSILLMHQNRVTAQSNLEEFDGETTADIFNYLNIIVEPDSSSPRSLSKAIYELEGLGYSDEEIPLLTYPVMEIARDVIKNKMSIDFTAKIWSDPKEVQRIVSPDLGAFLGANYKFFLYTQNITDRVKLDTKQLERLVYQDLAQKIHDLSKSQPQLFDKGLPGLSYDHIGN